MQNPIENQYNNTPRTRRKNPSTRRKNPSTRIFQNSDIFTIYRWLSIQEQKSIIIKDSQQAEFKQGFIFKLQLGGGTPDLSTQSLTIKIDDTKNSKLYISSQILL